VALLSAKEKEACESINALGIYFCRRVREKTPNVSLYGGKDIGVDE
jgi:hypothetical protein